MRYPQNYMTGTNPDGSTYDDLVQWINYFNGGDAVHGFVRGSFGFPQSLGCVELPVPAAANSVLRPEYRRPRHRRGVKVSDRHRNEIPHPPSRPQASLSVTFVDLAVAVLPT